MKISDEGIALIKHFEGVKLKAYKCPADVPTIGYGSTGPHVKMGMVITLPEAEELLRDDLSRFEDAVTKACRSGTKQCQFDAMVSLAFNVGAKAFTNSTLLKMHNLNKIEAAALQFARWNKAGGKVLAGLTKRRKAESELYLGNNWQS